MNPVKEKSFAFAIRIVNLCNLIRNEKHEYILVKQLLRSGTSIGANVREALNTPTQPDFVYKLSIAQKECDETMYWIELMKRTGYLDEKEYQSIWSDADELLKIIRSIILTSKSNSRKTTDL